jgi:acyl transferase domain-containing protein/acyl-CoA synthetase (AMP-forming)/AMP-acid ligase II
VPDLLTTNAARHGEKLAFADDRRGVTWAALARRTAGLDVDRGAHVAFCLDNSVELVEGLLATVRAAAVGVPLSPRGTDAELAALLADCDPAVLVTDRRHLPRLAPLAAERSLRLVVTGDGPVPDNVTRFDDLIANGTPRDDLGLDEPAWLLYTSGTTGTPRAAVFSQRSALWSPVACYQPLLGLSASDRLLWPLPLTHTYAHSLCVLGTTVAGASARITSDPAGLARLIDEFAPTVLAGVPLTYQQLLDTGVGTVPSLRLCVTAGAPSDPGLREQVEQRLGAPLLDGYGSTETCGKIAMETLDGPRVRGSSGPPLPGMDIRLVDPETGRETTEGEIWVRGPGVMLGYHNRPDALSDGWYHTGDLGRFGEHGCLTVTGRVNDRIVRGGENVDPAEVEQVLRGLPGVRDAAVVARAHPLLGEVPVAFVVPATETLEPAVLLRACADVLSEHKVPEEILFTPAIPRTAAGKPRRAVLREALAEHPADPALARLGSGERRTALIELVCTETAAISGEAADPGTAFADLGLTSMGAMTLWHRLSLRTGLSLPATLVWDHPNPTAVATYLNTRLHDKEVHPPNPSESPLRAPGGPLVSTLPEGTDNSGDREPGLWTTSRRGSGTPPVTTLQREPSAEGMAAPQREPVAIVAAACRYPGGVRSPEDLWRLVSDGVDATGEFPTDRGWDVDALYHPDPDRIGTTYTRRGGFLYDAADFDPVFFGISPREALATDPQQRLLLEVAWEAFERAGIPAPSVRGTRTGVFVGLMHAGYGSGVTPHALESHIAIGSAGSVASGRISYVLGLRGPSMTVDTACSSSLVGMDLAASALRAGECTLALAGGVTVMSSPQPFIAFSRQRGLAPDGRCRSFAAGAEGTAWGEGVGLVLLEKLADARRNGHPVLAVLRGSAVNSDGASNGLTAPNGKAQRELIRLALADAGLRASDVDVVEGHGTGTTLGDPIEANAVLATYGQDRDAPVWLGSVKSNLGHTQTAAGVAGVIKMIEAMRHGELPRSLYAEDPSPHVDWSAGAVRLLDRPQPWPAGGRPRRAAVSSFGIGGTNAHVIIEEPQEVDEDQARRDWPAPPWLVSGGDDAGLRAHADRLANALAGEDVLDVAYSLATTRTPLSHRAAVLATDADGLLAGLRDLAAGIDNPALRHGTARNNPTVALLCAGQGTQRAGMGSELAAAFPVFEAAFAEVCDEFTPWLDRPLRAAIDDPDLVNRTDYAQPALFAFEIAMHALLAECGVRPDYLVGHSIGELAAAHIAGVFSRADAVRLVAARGRLMAVLPAGGAMIAVRAPLAEVEGRLAETEGQLADAAGQVAETEGRLAETEGRVAEVEGRLAEVEGRVAEVEGRLAEVEGRVAMSDGRVAVSAVNGPNSVVLSGDEAAVTALAAALGRPTTRLRVSHAFHSPLLDPMLAEFRMVAESVVYHRPSIPVVSTVTGRPEPDAVATADYWVRQARDTVRFGDAVSWLAAAGVTAFVEAGPAPALSVLAEESVTPAAVCTTCADANGMLAALATLHVHGVPVDWRSVYAGSGARRRPLPTYPFQRQRYWLDAVRHRTPAGHPLVGEPQPDADGPEIRHTGVLSTARQPWLADHMIGDRVLVPATVFAELAFRAANTVRLTDPTVPAANSAHPTNHATAAAWLTDPAVPAAGGVHPANRAAGSVRLAELTFREPLVLSEPAQIQVVVNTQDQVVTVWACTAAGPWTQHATATIAPADPPPATPPAIWPPADAVQVPVDYARLAAHGHHYGPAFRAVTALWRRGTDLFADLTLPAREAATAYTLHPALLDAALHAALLAEDPTEPRVPVACTGVTVHAPGAATARAHLVRLGPDEVRVTLTDQTGRPLATVDSLVTRPLPAPTRLYRMTWQPATPATATDTGAGAGAGAGAEPRESRSEPSRVPRSAPASSAFVPTSPHELFDVTRLDAPENMPEDMPGRVRHLVTATLARVRDWVAGTQPGRLVVLTRNATGDDPDPAEAAVAGLVRSAQSEHPGRIVLVDGDPVPPAALYTDEPQIAVRDGVVMVPRLAVAEPSSTAPALDPDGTVLITGGTGALGASLARYLVAEHGIRHLLLVNRSGRTPAWVADLPAKVVACDVSDRVAVDALVASCQPLTAVFHLAGVVADGVVAGMTPERVAEVLAPKVDGAWHLHEATKDLGLSAFVLYSSAAGVLGRPGQSNYAAANGFLDALARHRVAGGLPAQALAWGPWSTVDDEGMAGRIDQRQRGDVPAVTEQEGIDLLDAALRTAEPVLVPLKAGPGILADLLPERPGPAEHAMPAATVEQAPGAWRDRLAAVPASEREAVLTELIRAELAAVLGFPDAATFPAEKSLPELGFDSLTGLQLRNRLSAFTRVRLAATVVLDHPTLPALTAHILAALPEPETTAEPPSYRFSAMFHRVLREKGPLEAMGLRFFASYALPSFPVADRAKHAVAPVQLAAGDGTPLVFIPDYLTLYHRVPTGLATRFDGERDLFLVEHPGFGASRAVPDSVATLVRTHADTVRILPVDRPVVLVGYCAGGAIAHAVARLLAEQGRPPAGVVLLDTHAGVLRRDERGLALLTAATVLPDDVVDQFDDSLLIAGGGYARVLEDWREEPSPVPSLLVRGKPTEQMRRIDPDRDWQPHWPLPHDTADVPGDHYSMIHHDADTTAEAIRDWIGDA